MPDQVLFQRHHCNIIILLYNVRDYLTYPTSTPISLAINPSTEKIAKPETTEAPELKPDRMRHHLNELKLNLLYDPFHPVFATTSQFNF